MNTSPASIPWKNGQRKDAQVVEGCKALQARQRPGQTFSCRQIAKACGVNKDTIAVIERTALRKALDGLFSRTRLTSAEKSLLAETTNITPKEIANRLCELRDPYKTRGKVKVIRRAKKQVKDPSLPTITEITERINAENTHKKWARLGPEALADRRKAMKQIRTMSTISFGREARLRPAAVIEAAELVRSGVVAA